MKIWLMVSFIWIGGMFGWSRRILAQEVVDPFAMISPVATTGGELILEQPGAEELVNIPDVVSPLIVCEQQPGYWGISYLLLVGVIWYGLVRFKPKTMMQDWFVIGGSGAALVFLHAIIGCACTSSLWCGRYWVIVLLSALSFAWYTVSFKQKVKR